MLTRLIQLARAALAATPIRTWLFVAAIASVLAGLTGLYLKGRHDGVVSERPRAKAAQARAAVQALQAQGATDAAKRVEEVVSRSEAVRAKASAVVLQAAQSEEAHVQLPPDVVARLRDADRQLCLTSPGLVGCPAP